MKNAMTYRAESSYKPTGILVLEDGSHFYGHHLTPNSDTEGEICFNTAMTGYQEVISDPSYAAQIVVFSFPHIGNVGVNDDDQESSKSYLNGIIMGTPPTNPSNFRAKTSLLEYIAQRDIKGLHSVDTRTLIKKIVASPTPLKGKIQTIQGILTDNQIAQIALSASTIQVLSGKNLAVQVGTQHSFSWQNKIGESPEKNILPYRIAVLDFGVKTNILKKLDARGVDCTVFPPTVSAETLIKEQIDGVVLSNGPGDPRALELSVLETVKKLIHKQIPILGICLGYQLLARIYGAKIEQLPSGHHGINHPVKDLITGKVLITSQNHEFVVEEDELPDDLTPTHRSLFDGTLEGFKIINKPIIAVQFHPEASPGPHDAEFLFDHFLSLVSHAAKK